MLPSVTDQIDQLFIADKVYNKNMMCYHYIAEDLLFVYWIFYFIALQKNSYSVTLMPDNAKANTRRVTTGDIIIYRWQAVVTHHEKQQPVTICLVDETTEKDGRVTSIVGEVQLLHNTQINKHVVSHYCTYYSADRQIGA